MARQHRLRARPPAEDAGCFYFKVLITVVTGSWLFQSVFSQQETCSALSIEGGVAPGLYEDQGTPNDGKPTYVMTVGGELYTLIFAEDTTRRKLAQDGAEGQRETWLPDGVLDGARSMVVHAMRRAERAEGRSLAACLSGFWINLASGDETIYPFYMTPDCADHPTEITETWFEFGCEDCDPEETSVTIDCTSSPTSVSTEAQSTELSTSDDMTVPTPTPESTTSDSATPSPDSIASSGTSSDDSITPPAGVCSVVAVEDATIPGDYKYSGESNEGYPIWTSNAGTITFGPFGPPPTPVSPSAAAEEGSRRSLAMVNGRKMTSLDGAEDGAAERRLACITGVWFIGGEPSFATYPFWAATDCADNIEDVEATWYEYRAEGKEPVEASPQPNIFCRDGASETTSTIDSDSIPSDTSSSSTTDHGILASTYSTPAPTREAPGSPPAAPDDISTTPTPAAAGGAASGASGRAGVMDPGALLARVVVERVVMAVVFASAPLFFAL